MDLANNHRILIEEIIKANDKYYGNEDLLEAFCSDVYKKSYLLLDSVSNIDNLKNYLQKVVDASITNILKQNARDITPKERPQREIQMDIVEKPEGNINNPANEANSRTPQIEFKQARPQNFRPKNIKPDRLISIKEDGLSVQNLSRDIFAGIEDPKAEFKEVPLKETVINRILSIVYELHTMVPQKGYFQIFYARHACFKKQAAVANELKITQGELSKRYFELVKLIKERL